MIGLLYNEAQQDAKVAQTTLTYILTVHRNEKKYRIEQVNWPVFIYFLLFVSYNEIKVVSVTTLIFLETTIRPTITVCRHGEVIRGEIPLYAVT